MVEKKGEKRGYPSFGEMSADPRNVYQVRHLRQLQKCQASEKARFKREKTGSKKISYQHRRKKKKK